MKKKLMLLLSLLYACSMVATISQQLDAYLQACTDLGYFSGSVLIARKGSILLSKGYGLSNHEHTSANTPHTKFPLSSLTKPFIALAIMQLHEKGLLSVHDRLSEYIPDYPGGNEITLHHLLTHTSGIKNYTALAEFKTFKKLPLSITQLIDHFKYVGLASNPGTLYKFSNSNYVLLCFIIERVTGQSYHAYIGDHICKPAGMLDTGYNAHAAIVAQRACGYTLRGNNLVNADYFDSTAVVGLGTLYSTVEDMYRFNQALNTSLLASCDSLTQMFTPYAQIGDAEDNISYGYGWATISLCGHTVKKHIGGIDGFSTAMYRFPEEEMYIIVLSNFEHALTEPMSFDLAAIVCGHPYAMPQGYMQISLDTTVYADYIGSYVYKGLVYTIAQIGDRLYFKQPDKEAYEIVPATETQFFIKGIPILLTFIKGEKGTVCSLMTKAFGKERVLIKIR